MCINFPNVGAAGAQVAYVVFDVRCREGKVLSGSWIQVIEVSRRGVGDLMSH